MRTLLGISLLLVTPVVFSANYFYCPGTTNYVYPGDTLDHVKQTCGTPTSSQTSEEQPTAQREVLRYIYDFHPNSGTAGTFTQNQPVELKKDALIVDFVNDKAVRITVEGVPATTTNYCRPDVAFKLGDNQQLLNQICRHPSLKKTITETVPQALPKQVTLTYKSPDGSQTQLIFKDGKLVSIQ